MHAICILDVCMLVNAEVVAYQEVWDSNRDLMLRTRNNVA